MYGIQHPDCIPEVPIGPLFAAATAAAARTLERPGCVTPTSRIRTRSSLFHFREFFDLHDAMSKSEKSRARIVHGGLHTSLVVYILLLVMITREGTVVWNVNTNKTTFNQDH